jgi:hypothetical protein
MVDRITQMFATAREELVKRCIKELRDAEAAAAAKKLPLLVYQVNYRVQGAGKAFGTANADQRREGLVAILRSLEDRELHAATSTWLAKLRIPSADTIIGILSKPLQLETDYIRVAEIDPDNSRHRGDADLQS